MVIDGGTSVPVSGPNGSRLIVTPRSVYAPHSRSTYCQWSIVSANEYFDVYGRLYVIGPPSKLWNPPASVTAASARASGVPCRTCTGLSTASISSRQASTPWFTAGNPFSSLSSVSRERLSPSRASS